jgi:hypothetical protein
MSSLSATAPWRRLAASLAAVATLLAACATPIERSSPMATPSRAPTRTESVPPLDARDHPTLETATFALG